MADARAPGLLGVDITDFNTVASLDLLFEKALAEMPPAMRRDAPIPQGAPLHFAQQRDVALLGFNFRRARLHRPFLLQETENPLREVSRRQCLASARNVLYISIKMLEGPSVVGPNQDLGSPLAYRAGLVISAMFTACAILALNAGLIWSRMKGGDRTNDASSELHGEITHACHVLAKTGEKSAFAANLVSNLVGVLKQYSVNDIDHLVTPPTSSNLNAQYGAGSNEYSMYTARDRLQSVGDATNVADNFTIWNEFFTTMPEMEGYDQLFAGLDFYCGPT
ncbi:hypothetical protein E0Z10_g4156 [Xylaria hypoxylon]|uniref:Uncharacterized protein n=1 Tax=Xylaria hypoxylon TaxID=37992 RepID=A0A4Z0YYT1_9PEZI|nr:hypothetical protein E0Z10_g4156 [Xylaria hypoxylon]